MRRELRARPQKNNVPMGTWSHWQPGRRVAQYGRRIVGKPEDTCSANPRPVPAARSPVALVRRASGGSMAHAPIQGSAAWDDVREL